MSLFIFTDDPNVFFLSMLGLIAFIIGMIWLILRMRKKAKQQAKEFHSVAEKTGMEKTDSHPDLMTTQLEQVLGTILQKQLDLEMKLNELLSNSYRTPKPKIYRRH